MQQRKALLLGATGLTGSLLLDRLLESELYSSVTIYVRKATGRSHPKLIEECIDFDTIQTAVEADDVFCCLGTTIKTAKTREAFSKVDLHYPVKIARLQLDAGSKRFLAISSMGANPHSMVFYSRTKGLMEEALQRMDYPSLYIFRPSFIVGNRTEKRAGEKMAIRITDWINPLLAGPLRNYASVKATAIADAMLHYATQGQSGNHCILSGTIKNFE
ncbi:MAG: NAD(P)H-binding protein [Sediminibacterium sp.]|nr:NAD(P)H-binding protein [Sediminibacterium sp.]